MVISEEQHNKIKLAYARAQNDLNRIAAEQAALDDRKHLALGERMAYETVLDLIKEK
jgi:hypothetical protein